MKKVLALSALVTVIVAIALWSVNQQDMYMAQNWGVSMSRGDAVSLTVLLTLIMGVVVGLPLAIYYDELRYARSE